MRYVITVFFLALLIHLPLAAQDSVKEEEKPVFTPYIMLRMTLGVWDRSNNYKDNYLSTAMTRTNNDRDYWEKLLGTSRFGINVRQDAITGNIEFGLADPNIVTLRHAYFTWSWHDFSLLAGQTWTAYSFFSREKADDDSCMIGFGATYDMRLPQVRLSYAGFHADIIKPTAKTLTAADNGIDIKESYIDTDMPKFAAGYEYRGSTFEAGAGAAYTSCRIDRHGVVDTSATANPATEATAAANAQMLHGKRIHSGLVYCHSRIAVYDLSIRANTSLLMNPSNFGMTQGGLIYNGVQIDTDDGDIHNTKSWEGFLELGYTLSIFELIVGYGHCLAWNSAFEHTDQQRGCFCQVNVSVTKNFSLYPEFAFHDFMNDKNSTDQGYEWYSGVCLEFRI